MRSAAMVVATLMIGCGARSGVDVRAADGGMDAASAAGDAAVDAAPHDAEPRDAEPRDAEPLDAEPRDAGPDAWSPPCDADAECDDLVACTDDRCESGVCVHEAVDARCDDGAFCNGVERCDGARGCMPGASPCDDGLQCTIDTCAEPGHVCTSVQDDRLCPLTRECKPGGCLLRAVTTDGRGLRELVLPTGALFDGPELPALTDVALAMDGTLYGVSTSAVYVIDFDAGTATRIASIGGSGAEVGPDGALYLSAGRTLRRLDPATGATRVVASLDALRPIVANGDLVFSAGRVLLTASAPGVAGDLLVEVSPTTGASRVVGEIGVECVWGLALHGGMLYGLTCESKLITIDPSDASSTLVGTLAAPVWGASVR